MGCRRCGRFILRTREDAKEILPDRAGFIVLRTDKRAKPVLATGEEILVLPKRPDGAIDTARDTSCQVGSYEVPSPFSESHQYDYLQVHPDGSGVLRIVYTEESAGRGVPSGSWALSGTQLNIRDS